MKTNGEATKKPKKEHPKKASAKEGPEEVTRKQDEDFKRPLAPTTPYLTPIIEQIEAEMKERADLESMTVLKKSATK